MSSIQIPNLGAAIALSGAEQLEAVQSGTSVRITTAQIGTYVNGQYPPPGVTSIATAAPVTGGTITTTGTISLATAGVTNTYLASMATKTLKANITGSTAGPTDATVTSVLDTIGNTNGNLLYRNATYWTTLGIGSSNYVLSSTGSAPQWVDVASIYTLSIGTTPLSNGTSGYVLYNNAGVLGNFALGTSVQTALGVNVGSAGSFVVNGGVLGTPSSGTLTNATGLPLTTGVTGTLPATSGGTAQSTYATGDTLYASALNTLSKLTIGSTGQVLTVAAGVPSWATLSTSAVTTFSAGTTGFTPSTATSGAITLAGTLAVTNGGTGVTTSTGSGNNVLSTSPTLVTPLLGTPTSVVLTNATGLPLTTGVTGTLPTTSGGTGLTAYTTGDTLYASATNTLSRLAVGTNGQILTLAAGIPSWATLSTSAVTTFSAGTTGFTPSSATSGAITLAGTLAVTNGGTGVTTSTGSGNNVLSTSPTLVTPLLGTPTSVVLTNATGLPLTTGVTGTLPIANGGTGQTTANTAFNALAPSQTSQSAKFLTTDGTNTSWGSPTAAAASVTIGTTSVIGGTSGYILYNNAGALGNLATTGTGSVVLATSPTLVTPALGVATATSLALGGATIGTNALAVTGTALLGAAVDGFLFTGGTGSGVLSMSGSSTNIGMNFRTKGNEEYNFQTAGGVTLARVGNSGSSTTNFLIFGGGASTNATISTNTGGITVTPATTLSAALTYGGVTLTNSVTGTGSMVLATSPTLVTPLLGTPTSVTLTNATGLPLTTGVTGTLPAANGGTAQSTYATGDTLYASALNTLSKLTIGSTGQVLTVAAGIPSWATLSTSAVTTFSAGTTGFTPSTATSGAITLAGTLAVANGGTGVTSSTGTGSVVLSASPTLTGTLTAATGTFSGLITGNASAQFNDTNAIVYSQGTAGYGSFYAKGSGTNNAYLFLGNVTTGENGRITSDNTGTMYFATGAGATTTRITLSTTLLTSTVALNYGGVTLANSVQGTGSMVLSASPTLTGTVSATGTLSITSSQSATQFTVNNSTNTAGSNATAFVHTDQTFLSGTNTGTYTGSALLVTTYPMAVSGNTGATLYVGTSDGSQGSLAPYLVVKSYDGKVGLGTASPSSQLHMTGALTYGGVTLSNSVQGTGSMVLSASPTFTGTVTAPTLNTSSSALQFNGVTQLYQTGSYTVLTTTNATAIIQGGNAADPQTYYNNGTHLFRNVATTTTYASISSALFTSNVALNYGGVTLSNSVTGTGSMVLSANPTFTGTLTAAAVIGNTFAVTASNVNAQTGTSYTLLAADNGKVVSMSNASASTLTVPSGLTAGFSCTIVQLGAGQVTITASSTTLRNRNGLKLAGQYAQAGLVYLSSETYSVGGDLST